MKRFGVMLDMSRNGVMKVSELKKYISIVKSFGYNTLLLYMEDTFEVANEERFGYLRGKYTIEELKDIVSFCDSNGIEVIPCVQTLAHLNQIFKWPEYKRINDCNDILLVDSPRTYQLIENIVLTLKDIFKSKYIHIGMDEAHMLGRGKFHDMHGDENKLDIISRHLSKVAEIVKKHGLKALMWSDMFFRSVNNGDYYPDEPVATAEMKNKVNKDAGLVYWDYYHNDAEYYDKMLIAHKELFDDVWFAGGAWTWVGFAPGNKKALENMFPAMESARKNNVKNIFITLWGDDGKECSFYSVLPALYAIKKHYDGETNLNKIKNGFEQIVGEPFDALFSLDNLNYVSGNDSCLDNKCKYLLYSDVFNGFCNVSNNDVGKEYSLLAKKYLKLSHNSKNYAYLYNSHMALCKVLEIKSNLGTKTRTAYLNGNITMLNSLIKDYDKLLKRIDAFYVAFRTLWFKENKPQGFDVQDIRIGALKQRVRSCRERLKQYVNKEIDDIPELCDSLLDFDGACLFWRDLVTVNLL